MSKIKQNLLVLMEPSRNAFNVSLKAGKMVFNRFCIDEDAVFELSGVNYLEKSSYDMDAESFDSIVEREVKGRYYNEFHSCNLSSLCEI